MSEIVKSAINLSKTKYLKEINQLTPFELHDVISAAVMNTVSNNWIISREKRIQNRTAYYFSAEFLVGRAIYNNLVSLGVYDEIEKELNGYGITLN